MQKAEIGRFDVEFLAPPISPNRDNRASKIEITQKGLGLKEVYTLLRGRCGHVVGRTKSAFTSDGSGDLLRSTETTKFDLNNGALLSFKEEKYASDGRTLVSIEDLTYEPRPYDEPKKVLSRIKILYDVDTHCEAYVFVQEVDPRNKAFI